MVVSELLEHLKHLDVRLSLASEGDLLNCDGPASVVNEELLGQLREHKPELLQLLNTPTLTDTLEGVERAQVSLLAPAKAAKAVHDSIGQGLCQRCRHLIASGVRVLACSCGYLAPRRETKINPRHLRYPIDYVRKNLPTLSAECREYFDYWLQLELAAGHDQDTAERVTFARMVDDVLAPAIKSRLEYPCEALRGPLKARTGAGVGGGTLNLLF